MTQNTMRQLEFWVGKPTCWMLTAVRSVLEKKPVSYPKPKKIVLLKLIEQGASVLAYSAIMECIERVGRKNVYFWVFAENQEIVRVLDLLPEENILAVSHRTPWAFAKSLWSSLRRLRRDHVDTVVDMEFFSRASAILSYLCGARVRVGLHRFTSEAPYRGNLFTHRVLYNPYLHTAKAYLHLVRTAFETAPSEPAGKMASERLEVRLPKFVPTASEKRHVQDLIRQEIGSTAEQRGRMLLLLNPNASDLLPIRKWPTENFVVLARRLLAEYENAVVLLTGAPSEKRVVEELARQVGDPRCGSMAGKTSLRQLFTLYSMSHILVTNDSGPGHFSSLTGVHSIVLFGPETPRLFGPLGETSTTLWNEVACSPCVSAFNHRLSPCQDAVCMKSISVGQVWAVVQKKLAAKKPEWVTAPPVASPEHLPA